MPIRSQIVMDTLVTMNVLRAGAEPAMDRAFGWFYEIEERCTRFDSRSEVMQLASHAGVAAPVSPIVFESVQFALKVAEETGGAFDPTIGHRMEQRGFNREYRTGQTIHSAIDPARDVSYRDVQLDPERRTIRLQRPLVIDLGAVAKGLAIDMAARELELFKDFCIDAGGDIFVGGCNAEGAPWSLGIRHPRRENAAMYELRASNQAVCTSGDYERGRHILDGRTGEPAEKIASATVIAPTAMAADALSTAAFVLSPTEGIALLERMEVEGLIVTAGLQLYETQGLRRAA
jgi:thiamine biosynthesis lipoprotein